YRTTIASAYDAGVDEEYGRLAGNPLRETEYRLITELLDEYIPENSVVVDIGAGPGRYAEYLLKRNCRVGLTDLSKKSLEAFTERMKNSPLKKNILFSKVSCATKPNRISNNSADALLLMGPMYHLITDEHRNAALQHCKRILKPGGFLFTIFLSLLHEVVNINESLGSEILSDNKGLREQIKEPAVTYTCFQSIEVPQFRCWPWQAQELLLKNSFATIRIRNIEGRGIFIPAGTIMNYNTPAGKAFLFNHLRESSEIPEFSGITYQFITVSHKI
ncbi:MAG: class I SAM-dependent methyltransferase, partial [Bacteroidales bacterium]|nr:class I SAM-dependent methyltransferase [Bacteroidales bacterium]